MDRAIAQATELGRKESYFSKRAFECFSKKERMDKKIEHLKKVAISSCEQSGRSIIPKYPGHSSARNNRSNEAGFFLACFPLTRGHSISEPDSTATASRHNRSRRRLLEKRI